MTIDWTIYIIECVAMIFIFTAMIMIPLCRNPIWWIHDYPKDIQEKYFENHERIPVEPLSATVFIKKACATLFAMVLLTGLILLTGANDFKSAFLLSYGLWFIINWYDCFFLDWVLFANIKRIRLPGTEDMDKAYHQKKYHVIRALYGMILGLIPSLLCGLIVMLVAV